jgi:carotenoid cleavage dioxygenase-like enzyme
MNPPLPIDGVLPPDLQGTLVRIGPSEPGGGEDAGALHAIELRDGAAVSYLTTTSAADANVFWHAGKVLALAESGLPHQFSRLLEREEFEGRLQVPVASHVRRDAADGSRILFGVEQGTELAPPFLRLGEWDATGALTHHRQVELERATWQHDIALTARHIVFIESPTAFSEYLYGGEVGEPEEEEGRQSVPVPYRWEPGAPGWVGVLTRGGAADQAVRWVRLDPCLVTHVLHAHDEADGAGAGGSADGGGRGRRGPDEGGGAVVLDVCRYEVPEAGQPVDLDASVIGPDGIGMSLVAGGLPILERWRIEGERLERTQLDDRFVEYPTSDPLCAAGPYRYGYTVELAANFDRSVDHEVDHVGLLRFDLARQDVAAWNPGPHRTASEPLFVRAADGRSDDEGWLLTMVHDAAQGRNDLYVLDASSFGRRGPQAVIHLPAWANLPFRSHGTWIEAARYR